MERSKVLCSVLMVLVFTLSMVHAASADVSPGDVIDKTNWDKAKGLLPEPVLNWVKKGDFTLQIDTLNYNPTDFFPAFAKKAFETNAGKYELDKDDGIIEVKTGKLPKNIIGIPFPKVSPDDPKAGQKLLYNNHYMQYLPGNLRFPFQGLLIARSGFDRETEAILQQMAMDGYPGSMEVPNPDGVEKSQIILIKTPYDVAGTAVMTWRYVNGAQQDSSFGYVPAIRRVRRMSPANRSDPFLGGDLAIDDANGYDGKITAFNWKVLRKEEAIIPALSKDPVLIVQNEKGEWLTTKDIKGVVYGYQKQGSTGASWAPTNLVWVKRPCYVIEMIAKDPYYNYGPSYMWVDAEIYGVSYKVINDKSGKYWKTFFTSGMVCQSADKTMQFISLAGQQVVDDRVDHSTIVEDASPRNIWAFYAVMDPNDFSLAGFQKFCK